MASPEENEDGYILNRDWRAMSRYPSRYTVLSFKGL